MTEKEFGLNEDKDFSFDFYGKDQEDKRQAAIQEKKVRNESFLKIGKTALVSVGLATMIVGGSYGGYKAYQNNIDKKVAAVEQTVRANPKEGLVGFINKEKGVAQKMYLQNSLLITDHAKYKEVIEVMNFGNQLATKNATNARVFKETLASIDKDLTTVTSVYDTLNSSRDKKVKNFLDGGNDLKKFGEWSNSLKNNRFMYVGGLLTLNKDLTESLKTLEQTQKDIIEHVQQRVKNKDFDLNAAQGQISTNLVREANSEVTELQNIRQLIVATGDLAGEDKEGNLLQATPKLQTMLTDEDVKSASDAMEVYKTEALSQIAQDRQKVEQMMSKISPDSAAALALTGDKPAEKTAEKAAAPVVIHSGPSFLDYYMMYHWMNMSNSMANNSAMNNNANNNHNYKPIPAVAKTNIYDLKNQNSHLNKTLSQTGSGDSALKGATNTFGKSGNAITAKPNLNMIRAQIDNARSKAMQANTVRASEMSRMKSLNAYEGGKSFASKAQLAKSTGGKFTGNSSPSSFKSGGYTSSSPSSASKGGFGGGRGGSSGG